MITKGTNMRRISKTKAATLLCVALCTALTACGHKDEPQEPAKTETTATEAEIRIDTQQGVNTGTSEAAAPSEEDSSPAGYSLIQEQTFEATLEPLGKVTFVSYRPDSSQNPLADAMFKLQQGGKTIDTLEGMYEGNIRANDAFDKVEAVSFPDYNNDGYNDTIIICSYTAANGAKDTGNSEARIYSGSSSGAFTLEKSLTENANAAVAEKSVKSILGFLGAGKSETKGSISPWQQAYIDHLESTGDDGRWQGYTLIYLNDDLVPELVEIGSSEAAGCGIVTFADGTADETLLSRLNFTYIENGNLLCNSDGLMDYYYDIVYKMENGRLVQVAAGYYGAEDNSNVQYDENGDPVYQYEWDGVMMTPEEYDQAFRAVYDSSAAKLGYAGDKLLTKDEAIEVLRTIQ